MMNNHSITWGKTFLLLSVTLLLVFIVAATAPDATPRAQPILLEMAALHPDVTVNVIVQKYVQDKSVEELVVLLNGVITRDLSIINAFAAQLPAKAVPPLARARGVRWISLDAPIVKTDEPTACAECLDTSNLENAYIRAIGADRLWNAAPYLQGQGITVAVVDSGVNGHQDLNDTPRSSTTDRSGTWRVIGWTKTNSFTNSSSDRYGHGTHIAGIIGGNGSLSRGAIIGVAPKVNLVDVKVSDDEGKGKTSDVVAGLQWVYNNKQKYNIRVVNLSLTSSVAESYHTSPLDAALEVLWFNRIVVVVSAGNKGPNGVLYPPANDPFVITVGAADDLGTMETSDDRLAPFSGSGATQEGHAKPDLVSPGVNIVSLLGSNGVQLAKSHPDHLVSGFGNGRDYLRLSGTSMSSAVTAGAVALLLQNQPNLTPDQVKYRLKAAARPFPPGSGAGHLDIYAAVRGTTRTSANLGLLPSELLKTGTNPVAWDSLNWDSLNWDSLNWDSLHWDSVDSNSLNWDTID